MFKRIFLFILTNIAVMVMFSIVLAILSAFGINTDPSTMGGLLVFSAVFGFLGSFVSLLLSKTMALKSVGGRIIENPTNQDEAWLLSTVERLAMQWNLKTPHHDRLGKSGEYQSGRCRRATYCCNAPSLL